jgi:hypothetical protein
MTLDQTYFVTPIIVPNLSSLPVQEAVADAVALHGPKMMKQALGLRLYQAYIAGIEAGSDASIASKWLALKNGVEFENRQGQYLEWVGFDSGNPQPTNPVAAYVWFYYQRYVNQAITGAGGAKSQAENATVVVPVNVMVEAWNEMVKQVHVLWQYLELNPDTYPEYSRVAVARDLFKTLNVFGI